MAKKRFAAAAATDVLVQPSNLYVALDAPETFRPMEHTRAIASGQIFHRPITPGFKHEDLRKGLKEFLSGKTYQHVTVAYVSPSMRGYSLVSFYKKSGTYNGTEALDKIMGIADNEITETRYRPPKKSSEHNMTPDMDL